MKKWLSRFRNNGSKEQLTESLLQQAETARADEELKILYSDFAAAWQYFKENYKDKHNIPLYLVVGQSSFGKTTLLANSGLDLHDTYGNQVQNNFSTKYCVWLFSQYATFLDTAGVYSVADKDSMHAHLVWLGFLRFLQGRFWSNPLGGVVVVIDIPTLLGDRDKLQRVLHDARERLYEIAQYVDMLPIYVVFTKLDVLAGFSDFFADLSLEERQQPFGINFIQEGKYVNPQHVFAASFTLLLNRLQEKLRVRLQGEESVETRQAAQEFFAQFGTLNEAINIVLSELPYGGHIVLHGCYFVSSLQNDSSNTIDSVVTGFAHNLPHLQPGENRQFALAQRVSAPYFTDGLFKQIMLVNAPVHNVAKRSVPWLQALLVFVLAICLGAVTFIWHSSYKKSAEVFAEVAGVLHTGNSDSASKLEQAITIANINNSFWWAHLGFTQLQKLKDTLGKVYYQKFSAEFIARLQKNLEEELTVTSAADYKYLYDTLKAYIMLGDGSKMDRGYIKNWFEKYWQKQYADNPAQAQRLLVQLAIILPQGIQIKLAPQILATARELLNSHNVPKEDLVYVVLEKQYDRENLEFKFAANKVIISKLYSVDNVAKVYNKQIPQMVYALSHKNGDWVLMGKGSEGLDIPQGDMDQLIAALRALYVKNYVDAWSRASQQVSIVEPTDIKKMQQLLVDIKNSDYPLLSFLKIMQLNLGSGDIPPELHKLIDDKLPGIATIDLKAIYSGVNTLLSYLTKIATSSDVNRDAFIAATMRFGGGAVYGSGGKEDAIDNLSALAEKQPSLVKNWLQDLSNSSWQSILASTRLYVNNMWAASVLPEYNKIVYDAYPFFKNADKSIALDDLAKFFAADGIMDSFFNKYLRVFVDTDQVYWTWKKVDGQSLGFDQDKLELFIRAALIKKMFYPNGGQTPRVNFSLRAHGLTPHTQKFSLNLAGQEISYTIGHKGINNLVWPGPQPGLLKIGFVNQSGGVASTTMPYDPWNWFRLLDKTNFKAIEGTQKFGFTFDLNGNAVKYEMDVVQPINPFIAGVIENFRCPEKL